MILYHRLKIMSKDGIPLDIKSYNEYVASLPEYENYINNVPTSLTETILETITDIYNQSLLNIPFFSESPNSKNARIISMLRARNIVYNVKYSERVQQILDFYDGEIEKNL